MRWNPRWTQRLAVGLVALLLLGTGGYAGAQFGKALGVADGAFTSGRLSVVHFRPLDSAALGCQTPEAKFLALETYTQRKGSLLARTFSPPAAHAAPPSIGCLVLKVLLAIPNRIIDEGETALRDCFNANAGTECGDVIDNLHFHGLGTGTTAAAETDTGCETELTTQYNPDSTRATGSQATNGANVYRTVGTNTVDASAAVTEFCLESAASGAVVTWSRIVFSVVNLSASDSLQTTYDLTID